MTNRYITVRKTKDCVKDCVSKSLSDSVIIEDGAKESRQCILAEIFHPVLKSYNTPLMTSYITCIKGTVCSTDIELNDSIRYDLSNLLLKLHIPL